MSSNISVWEQHGQTILTSLILAVLLWVGYNVNENSRHSAVAVVEIAGLKQQVKELKQVVNSDVQRIGSEQSSRGPRITANEFAIRDIYKLIRIYHNGVKEGGGG